MLDHLKPCIAVDKVRSQAGLFSIPNRCRTSIRLILEIDPHQPNARGKRCRVNQDADGLPASVASATDLARRGNRMLIA
jgi:hypothetical protein